MSTTHEEAKEIYRKRDILVHALAALPVIGPDDLAQTDRGARCIVASDLWAKCSEETRKILLNDKHPWVRSCAELSLLNLNTNGPMYLKEFGKSEVAL